ncbi:hypothetical protein U1Q18_008028, partial [Sarracenia purpurea var. burkii]
TSTNLINYSPKSHLLSFSLSLAYVADSKTREFYCAGSGSDMWRRYRKPRTKKNVPADYMGKG